MSPAPPQLVSYLRVSTDSQGRSGLGLDAQRQAVAAHVAAASGQLVAEFQEIESGKRANQQQLAASPGQPCRTRRAVSKPYRQARSA